MIKLTKVILYLIFLLLLGACNGTTNSDQSIVQIKSGPNPSIKILNGSPNTCVMTDNTQSTLISFGVEYNNIGTDSYMVGILSAPDVGEIGRMGAEGEGRNGEGSWGIYPESYILGPDSPISLEIIVHKGADETAPISSTSKLTYNCTSGEIINSEFEVY